MTKTGREILPRGWAWGKIADLCDVNPPTDVQGLALDTPVPFVPMAAVGELSGSVDASQFRPLGSVLKGFTKFAPGDVIFAKITPCMENGKIAIVPPLEQGIAFGSTEFHVLRPRDGGIADYVFYFAIQEGFRARAKRAMSGAVGQQRVPREFLAECPIPIAPLAEQRRIVAKIEELFGEIEVGEQELARAGGSGTAKGIAHGMRPLVHRLRQSVLAAAFSGKLTEQDVREESATAMLARINGSSPRNLIPRGGRRSKATA